MDFLKSEEILLTKLKLHHKSEVENLPLSTTFSYWGCGRKFRN